MASALESVAVNIDCNGKSDVDRVVVYNVLNVGRFVVNSFENTFNFCVSVGLLNEKRKCLRCRHMLKLSVDRRDHTTTPVVLCCSNKLCPKDYYSICDGTFLIVQSCLRSGKTVWLPGLPRTSMWNLQHSPDCSRWRGGWLPSLQ